MIRQQANMAALYCRLSRDDGGDSESNSITTQRQMLGRYAKEQGFSVYDEYIDDGISGTTFERPNFKRMIHDIEEGKVGIVLCKDLSRLGRNNALVAYYTEIFFPDNDVRLIAIGDAIDTAKGDNEIMPFKSVVNEYYARDISRKIRASNRILAQNGKFLGGQPPFGYKKAEDDYHKLVVDEQAAPIVKRMFQMAADGVAAIQIARTLSREKILTPRAYLSERTGKYTTHYSAEFPTDWGKTTVVSILRNREYLGHLVSHKRGKKSFKSKKQVDKPESEWIIVPNTHEALVDEATFEKVQRFLSIKRPVHATGKDNIFAGLLVCSTCGVNLGFAGTKPKNGAYVCNRYRKFYNHCTSHYISHDALKRIVLADIQTHIKIANEYEDDLSQYVSRVLTDREEAGGANAKQEIDKLKARRLELDRIIKKLLEQNALGAISDERFFALSSEYETEERDAKDRISELQGILSSQKSDAEDAKRFYELLRKYTELSELTASVLHDLIDHIVVHNAVGRYKERTQKVEIYYRFMSMSNEVNTSSP